MLATNPTKSPVMPPPTPIIKSDLLKFFDSNLFKKKFTELKDFAFSLELKLKILVSYFFKLIDIYHFLFFYIKIKYFLF